MAFQHRVECWKGVVGSGAECPVTCWRRCVRVSGYAPPSRRVWATERKSDVGNRHVVSGFQSFFLPATKDLVEVPKYHDCGRGLQILSRSRDGVLEFELLQSTPQYGTVINKGEQTPGGYNTGSLGSLQEFHKITGTGDALIPRFNWKHQNKAEPTVLWFWQVLLFF